MRLAQTLLGLSMTALIAAACPGAEPPTTRPVEAIARERLDVARQGFEIAREGQAVGRSRHDELMLWSRRWAEAAVDVATTRELRLAALEQHLGRLRDAEQRTREMFQAGAVNMAEVLAARYATLEAELWLARVAGDGK